MQNVQEQPGNMPEFKALPICSCKPEITQGYSIQLLAVCIVLQVVVPHTLRVCFAVTL